MNNENGFNNFNTNNNQNSNNGYNQFYPTGNDNQNNQGQPIYNQNVNNRKKKNNPLKIILIVLLIIVLLISLIFFIVPVIASNHSNANKFKATAKLYIASAKWLVATDFSNMIYDGTSVYYPLCTNNGNSKNITLREIINGNIKSSYNTISPYGGNININSSYVKITSKVDNDTDSCDFEYAIYLTDDTHSIGTPTNPIAENDIKLK